MKRLAFACALLLLVGGRAEAKTTGPCGTTMFVTYASGRIAGIDWVDARSSQLHTRSELTQSMIIDATITIKPDMTTPHASTTVIMAGSKGAQPVDRDIAAGAVFWSDSTPSSVQLVIARARALDKSAMKIPVVSHFTSLHGDVDVQRIDELDWTLAYHNKRYDVLTDQKGCMLAASLPANGVTIERRSPMAETAYPLWAPYAAPPDHAYAAADVSITAPQGRVLAGTLTAPLHGGPFPAAVLISGLSPHERNNGTPPWMPFRDIADALTRAGIAVLRVDDRGIGASTGDNGTLTTFGKADDVRTEVRWLRARAGIDAHRIMLVGYSEGGLIAPMVAASDPSIAGVITLGGPGVNGWDVGRYQIAAAVNGDPTIAPADRSKEIARQLAEPLTPHERSYLSIDPLAYDRRVKCPALIIQGGTDLLVPLRSAERIANAMRSAGNHDVIVRLFPNVSHALLSDVNGLNAEWSYVPSALTSPDILGTMTEWARARLDD